VKIAYLDCASGISGDMTLAALVDAGVELAALQEAVSSLGLPEVRLVVEEVKRKGFRALHVKVEHPPEHAHRHLSTITKMIDGSSLTARQKEIAKRIFTRLGEAEAKVHGQPIEKVHFHEVGAVDSICDIVGAAVGWDLLGVERIVASPIPTGTGFVNIAHGRCSIPAPATGELLRGVPLAASNVEAELTTPTGAAILAGLADSFGPVPPMSINKIGYGAGTRELESQPNILRLLVGETTEQPAGDRVFLVETNLDDSSGELLGYATARLWKAGALDVFTEPIAMKKDRPGVRLSVLCGEADIRRIESVLFRETTTLGVRRWPVERTTLERTQKSVTTTWGDVDGTVSEFDGHTRFAPEYESCRRIAEEKNVPLQDVQREARQAFERLRGERGA